MEWKIYEKWLDITLYRQMTNLIYKLSSNEEKEDYPGSIRTILGDW